MQEQNLEERGEQATHPQRVEEEHAAFGLCHAQVLARLDAHHAAHVANHDAHEHEHDVKPDDEPDAVPDALAHRGVFLGPRTDALHANGHGKAGERQQGAKRGPLLDVLIAREAAQDAADEAHAHERGTTREELHGRTGQRELPERQNRLRDESENASHAETIEHGLVRFHVTPPVRVGQSSKKARAHTRKAA